MKISDKNKQADELFRKGDIFADDAEYKKAITCYDKALKINPNDESGWNSKGTILLELDEPEKAIICFDKALKINPKYGWGWFNKGLAFYDLGKYNDAIKCYDKALKITPKDSKILNEKINALKELKKYEGIEKIIKIIESTGESYSISNND